MALRNQPYLPLYVNDFLTDQKLIECSAESTGVYIRLMCLMHKSEEYGTITLKEKDKIKDDTIYNLAFKISKLMPYTIETVKKALDELLEENVLELKKNTLIQRRMLADNSLSKVRSKIGKKGGLISKNKGNFGQAKVQAKGQANTEYEYVYENEDNIGDKEIGIIIEYLNDKIGTNYKHNSKIATKNITARMNEGYSVDDFKKVINNKSAEWLGTDFEKFLTPNTLFGTKFEVYLNQKRKKTLDEIVEEIE